MQRNVLKVTRVTVHCNTLPMKQLDYTTATAAPHRNTNSMTGQYARAEGGQAPPADTRYITTLTCKRPVPNLLRLQAGHV